MESTYMNKLFINIRCINSFRILLLSGANKVKFSGGVSMKKIIEIIRILLGLNESDKERNYCKYSKDFRSWKSNF